MASKQFTRLTNSVYFAEPVRSATRKSSYEAPQIVLMFGWMDAQMKHLAKYAAGYHRVYPSSTILLVRSSQSSFYSRAETQLPALSPAVEFLRARLGESGSAVPAAGPSSGLLVHTSSNGGCLNLKMINEMMLGSSLSHITKADSQGPAEHKTDSDAVKGIPARAVVFDSCPGNGGLKTMVSAFTVPLNNWLLKAPAMVLVALVFGMTRFFNALRFRPSILEQVGTYVATQIPLVPRLYLYSETDKLIPAHHVEANAQRARQQGGRVTMLKFDGTEHVNHARKEPEKYWGAVKELWEGAGHHVETTD
ncbi:BQ2448_3511 [Microbotryum intermedium]|uniref:BQ2448_3511 protein n=1 Tax=Microbotryum intermedium TaxID=269621 RepID=A0A238FDA2_9BASI|nr:BQ2448_3511 [Microbotryum intermedium]